MFAQRALTKDVERGSALVVALVLLLRSALATEGFPDPTLEQAKFFGRRGNIEAALRLCEESIARATPESAITVALVIARQGPVELTPVQQHRILGWIDTALAESPDRPAILLLAADLKDLQGEYQEVATMYRDLLCNDSLSDQQRAIVLNNLAYLMAVDENNGDDALPLIEEALQLVGPNSDLFDTRGAVWLAQGKPWAAIRDFRRAVRAAPSPIKVFHLADALLLWNDEYRAEATFESAIEMGLEPADIPPLERGNYEALRDRLRIGFDE